MRLRKNWLTLIKINNLMRVGITGSKGFIGSHLVGELSRRKIKMSFFDKPVNNLLGPKENSLKKFVLENDVIVHIAAINRGTDVEVVAGSVVATYNLIAAMEKYKSKAKIIFLSSIQAETDTLYGKSKRLAEIMLEDFSKRNKIPVTIFRLTNVFGEGGKPFYHSVVATFCHQIANNKGLTVNSGRNKFRFLYVGDLVKIIIKELGTERKNYFYFKKISSNNEISVSNLAKVISGFKNKPKLKTKFHRDLYKTYLSYSNGK